MLFCLLLLSVFLGSATCGARVQALHQFSPLQLTDGYPSPLVLGPDGNFYGTSNSGGSNGKGAIIRVSPAGDTTILHSFGPFTDSANNINADGVFPNGGVILGADGNFYGTTSLGGLNGTGTIYKMTAAGALITLHNFAPYTNGGGGGPGGLFANPDGSGPNGVIQGTDGNFYGTARYGGSEGIGVIFRMAPDGALTVLHDFSAEDDSDPNEPNYDGASPIAGLIQGKDGNFYGTAQYGGSEGDGTLFRISSTGTFDTLHSFDGDEGGFPAAPPTQGADGSLYGTTAGGGDNQDGTVFRFTPDGILTILHSFNFSVDGGGPLAPLLQGTDGNFYGTVSYGGAGYSGTIFCLTPAGEVTVLHSFSGDGGEGSNPAAVLFQDQNGGLRGVTTYRGAYGQGTLFVLNAGGILSVLHDFGRSFNDEGADPVSALVQGSDGSFYGTAQSGGFTNNGTIFKISAAGVVTTLHSFSVKDGGGHNVDGANPQAGLIQGSDGSFYGTAPYGGSNGTGTVFKITPAGNFTTLHSFSPQDENFFNADGAGPRASLIQGKDGSFYGTASVGGANGNGTLFKVTAGGTFTTLYSFSALDDNFVNPDGANPAASLVQGKDGNFYGTASQGGVKDTGTIFKVTATGEFTSLYSFDALDASRRNKKGAYPSAALVQGSDGSFYGTAPYGGINGTGTIFAVTSDGKVSTLHSFSVLDSNYDNSDGANPSTSLILGADGSFYGTAAYGGVNGTGTIFKVNAGGTLTSLSGGKFTTLYSFSAGVGYAQNNSEGASPYAPLVQTNDGNFYGTTRDGGLGLGTVFKYGPDSARQSIAVRNQAGTLQSQLDAAPPQNLIASPGAHPRRADLVEQARQASPAYGDGAIPFLARHRPPVGLPARTPSGRSPW